MELLLKFEQIDEWKTNKNEFDLNYVGLSQINKNAYK